MVKSEKLLISLINEEYFQFSYLLLGMPVFLNLLNSSLRSLTFFTSVSVIKLLKHLSIAEEI